MNNIINFIRFLKNQDLNHKATKIIYINKKAFFNNKTINY